MLGRDVLHSVALSQAELVHKKPAESGGRGMFHWGLALEVKSDSGMGLGRFMLISLNKLTFTVWRALGEGSWGHTQSWYWLVSLLLFQTRNILGLRRLLRSVFRSRTHLPLLVAMYLLALHVLLFLCFTGHLWTGITAVFWATALCVMRACIPYRQGSTSPSCRLFPNQPLKSTRQLAPRLLAV